MADSTEECTEYVRVWLVNDPSEILFPAMEHARNSPDDLASFVTDALNNAPEGTGAYYTRRNLSDFELANRIDWEALAVDILGE